MDAAKFVSAFIRMCAQAEVCYECPIGVVDGCDFCSAVPKERSPEGCRNLVDIVERWDAAHPRDTRQRRFLEMFPNAARDARDILNICPKLVDVDVSCTNDETERTGLWKDCDDCRCKYWDKEVEVI